MSGLLETDRSWQFSHGQKVRIRNTPEDATALVLRRLPGLPFPHYEVMDDDGFLIRVAQLELSRVRP